MPPRSPLTPAADLTGRIIALALWLAMGAAPAAQAIQLPANFTFEDATPAHAFTVPTSIVWLPDGRMLVAERRGLVHVVQNGVVLATPFIDLRAKVLNAIDRGLIDIAVDPNFATTRWVYMQYTVDPDSNGSGNGTDPDDDAYGRLVRYQASIADPNVADLSTRQVLFGRNWAEGPASGSITHTVGSLRWGTDGSLIVSIGEGAHHESEDFGGQDPNMFTSTPTPRTNPLENIGAYRAQYLESLAGKILRINPSTGQGYSTNPFWDGNGSSVKSRIWAYGVRNPFRIAVRPGSGSTNVADGDPGSIFIGDVGWNDWEEVSVAKTGGKNFGWPCYEGTHVNQLYLDAPDPSHHDCSTIGTPANPSPHTPPITDWHHTYEDWSSPAGTIGNTASGAVFYTGTSYPGIYQGALFHAEYTDWWVRVIRVDGNDNPIQFLPFGTDMEGPVDLKIHPINQDLYFIGNYSGKIYRVRYTGPPNQPPVAVASGAPLTGTAPLTVNFSSAGSNDPDMDPLGYSWNFGDGNGSFAENPPHVYASDGFYTAILTVSDGRGGTDTASVLITVGAGNTPPTSIIAAPANNGFYIEGQNIVLNGDGTDAEQSASSLFYDWDIALHHNTHQHPGAFASSLRNDTFEPQDHEDGTGTWLEVKLYVTDAGGLSDTTSVNVWPQVDLDPGPVTVSPDPARRVDVNQFSFKLRNYGQMMARKSHWMLLAGSTVLAEGDTLVGPLDSLTVSVPVDVFLLPGVYPLRVVTDTLAVVHETSETNNAKMRTLMVVPGPVGVGPLDRVLSLSSPVPNPTTARTTVYLDLPKPARVALRVVDVLGRDVWSSPARDLGVGRWPLQWDASRTGAGVYMMVVDVDGTATTRRVAVIR